MIAALRQGGFITQERARLYPRLMLLAFLLSLVWLLATSHGLTDYAGRPLGSDFSSFYAAGRLMMAGQSPYDQAALRAMEQTLFGHATPFYSFSYPPVFLLIVTPLAKLPYMAALAVWQGVSLLLYLAAMLRLRRTEAGGLDRQLVLVAAIAFGAVFINLTHGQNGFLTAALFAFALSFLEKNPIASGACFGLLAIKPQLGLLIPFALAFGGYWRAFAAAALSLATTAIVASLLFGWTCWPEFFAAAHFSEIAILDQGAVGYDKMISIFAALRAWGSPLAVAYGVQLLTSLAVIAALARFWRAKTDLKLKGAALCFATLLATPFALDYDLMVLAPAILLLAGRDERLPFEASVTAVLWLMPLAVPGLALLGLPLAALATGIGFMFCFAAAR
jgi:hypothetical protein